ncbi:MAG TPA: glycosyltransferase family 1 protein [Actinomycetota bacterium]|nr:glycosyltransferase family 1 protein [Actinomycetota bacterium]
MSLLRVAMTLEQCWHRVPGGVAVAALGMARALRDTHKIHLTGVAAAHRRPAPPQWTPPVPVRRLSLPRPLLYEAWHRLRAPAVERATGPVDVIHATTMAIPPRKAPLVVTIHDLAWIANPGHFTPHGVRFFERGLELARRDADLVLCPSAATLEDCKEHGFDGGRLRHIPLGVEIRPIDPEDVARVRSGYGLTERYVMWTGTIEPRKNLPRLLEAFRSIPKPVELILVGPSGWNEDIDQTIGSSELRTRVRTLGFVPKNDLAALYKGASVFCFPSLLEGFGFPILEAMAQGTPVVTSIGTSTEELAGDAALLVDPLDPGAIAAGIKRALDMRTATRLSAAGPSRAAEFGWDKTAVALIDAYREVSRA